MRKRAPTVVQCCGTSGREGNGRMSGGDGSKRCGMSVRVNRLDEALRPSTVKQANNSDRLL